MPKKTTPSNDEGKKDPEVAKINSIGFMFDWASLQPDVRAYKPSNPLLTPSKPIHVRVDVPVEAQFIYNAQKINIGQLTNQDLEEPVLTPLGMRYIIDQFETAMSNGKQENSEQSSEDSWEDEDTSSDDEFDEKKSTKKSSKKSEDDEWEDDDDEPAKKEEKEDVPWSEEDESWEG